MSDKERIEKEAEQLLADQQAKPTDDKSADRSPDSDKPESRTARKG